MTKFILTGMFALSSMIFWTYGAAQTSPRDAGSMSSSSSDSVAPDNTKSNKVNPSNRGSTADQQMNNSADIALTKRIRQGVVGDKSLSTYGHNVKIVSVNGSVTLNGVVSNSQEKMKIEQIATSIAGEGHVTDELKVVPPK
jgi:hyperosmotically inducible periplasmic protein